MAMTMCHNMGLTMKMDHYVRFQETDNGTSQNWSLFGSSGEGNPNFVRDGEFSHSWNQVLYMLRLQDGRNMSKVVVHDLLTKMLQKL
jgi:hypothetical protein